MDWTHGTLSDDVRLFLEKHNKATGYGTELSDLVETLTESKEVWKGKPDDHRWWYTYDSVVEIEGKFIMYPWAVSTRDMSARESGWMMDLGCVCFVKPVEKTIIVYE